MRQSKNIYTPILKAIKNELRLTASSAISKLSLTQQWYSSGGGGFIVHATVWVKHPDLAEAAADMLRDSFTRHMEGKEPFGREPSLHELWRDAEGNSLRKPLPKGMRNDRWEK